MKAISLTQPWATLVVTGRKAVETRGWSTSHVGQIAIHAAKQYPRWAKECASEWRLRGLVHGTLPVGALVGIVTLLEVTTTNAALFHERISEQEREFGDYSSGRYAWFLGDAVAFEQPIPCAGALRVWDVPVALLDAARSARTHAENTR